MNTTPANPPPRSAAKTRTNFPATFALTASIISAGAAFNAIDLARKIGEITASYPAYTFEGGMGFSMNFPIWVASLAALGIGLLAGILLMISCMVTRSRRKNPITLAHLGSAFFLVPCIYLGLRLLSIFF